MKIDKSDSKCIRFSSTEPTPLGPVEVLGRMENGIITVTAGDYRLFIWSIAEGKCIELDETSTYGWDGKHAYDALTGRDMARFTKSFVNYLICDSLSSFGC